MSEQKWKDICELTDLVDNSGVCALVNGEQVALFYLPASQSVYAVSNWDPIGEANVLYRGLMGSVGDTPVVASPLYKQRFDLTSGLCLDDETISIKTWPVRLHDKAVQLAC